MGGFRCHLASAWSEPPPGCRWRFFVEVDFEFAEEVGGRSPIDIDARVVEVALEILLGAASVGDGRFRGIDLNTDVVVTVEELAASFGEDEAEHDAELPVVERETEEEQGTAYQGVADDGRHELIAGRADEVVEEVVLSEHPGRFFLGVSEEVIDIWALNGCFAKRFGLRCDSRGFHPAIRWPGRRAV